MKRHSANNRLILTLISCLAMAVSSGASEAGDQAKATGTAFHQMFAPYDSIRTALLNDGTEGVATHARKIRDIARALAEEFDAKTAGVDQEEAPDCAKLMPEIAALAEALAVTESLESSRDAFAKLTPPMVRYRQMIAGERPVVVYCSMAEKAWLQPAGPVGNPYYGQSMAACGEVVAR